MTQLAAAPTMTANYQWLPLLVIHRLSICFGCLSQGQISGMRLMCIKLGALLHDLIMRRPLFDEEYKKSQENRYRFAWIVATVDPQITAEDVDQDLVFLARRALDKDWPRRCKLQLEDFLADTDATRNRSLQLLGLGPRQTIKLPSTDLNRRLIDVSRSLEEGVRERLRQDSVTATHRNQEVGSEAARRITFRWSQLGQQSKKGAAVSENELVLTLGLSQTRRGLMFDCVARIEATIDGMSRNAEVGMPSVEDSPEAALRLVENALAALGELALQLARAP